MSPMPPPGGPGGPIRPVPARPRTGEIPVLGGPGSPLPRRPRTGEVPAAGHAAPPAPDATTPSGLRRRVRGAQLPNTQPLSMRRGSGDTGNRPRQPQPQPPRQPGGDGPDASGDSASNDVYGFLSAFTAGVQKGLDDARNPQSGSADDPSDENN